MSQQMELEHLVYDDGKGNFPYADIVRQVTPLTLRDVERIVHLGTRHNYRPYRQVYQGEWCKRVVFAGEEYTNFNKTDEICTDLSTLLRLSESIVGKVVDSAFVVACQSQHDTLSFSKLLSETPFDVYSYLSVIHFGATRRVELSAPNTDELIKPSESDLHQGDMLVIKRSMLAKANLCIPANTLYKRPSLSFLFLTR